MVEVILGIVAMLAFMFIVVVCGALSDGYEYEKDEHFLDEDDD